MRKGGKNTHFFEKLMRAPKYTLQTLNKFLENIFFGIGNNPMRALGRKNTCFLGTGSALPMRAYLKIYKKNRVAFHMFHITCYCLNQRV